MKVLQIIKKNEFYKNVAKLSSGTFIAQFISFLISPILTRIYSPQEFGVLAVFASVSVFLSIIVSGGLEYAILLPRKDSRGLILFVLSLVFSVVNSLIILLVLLVMNSVVSNYIFGYEMKGAAYLVAASVMLQGIFRSMNYLNTRHNKFGAVGISSATRSVVTNGVHFSLGVLEFGTLGLVFGNLAGHFIAVASLGKNTYQILRRGISNLRLHVWKLVLGRYRQFPLYKMPSELINNLSVQIPIYLLNLFFTKKDVGFYSLPQRIITLPFALIGSSISQAYFKEATLVQSESRRLSELVHSVFSKLFIVGVLPFSILTFWSDFVFSFVFGEGWVTAGKYAQIISPWLFIVFCISPLSVIFTIKEKQKEGLLYNVLLLFVRITSLLLGGLFFKDVSITIILYGAGGFAFWVVYAAKVLSLSHVAFGSIKKLLLKGAGVFILIMFTRLIVELF